MPELLTTRHTYSPESAGVTWGRRSLEPCTWAGQEEVRLRVRPQGSQPGSCSLPWPCSQPGPVNSTGKTTTHDQSIPLPPCQDWVQ